MRNTLSLSTEILLKVCLVGSVLVEKLADYCHVRSEIASLTQAHLEMAHFRSEGRPVWRYEMAMNYRIMVVYFFGTQEEILDRFSVAEVMSS